MFLCIYVCRHGILSNHRLSGKQLSPARSVKNAAPSNKRSGGFAFICAARALLQVVVLFHFDARFPDRQDLFYGPAEADQGKTDRGPGRAADKDPGGREPAVGKSSGTGTKM